MIGTWQETPKRGNKIAAALCLCFGVAGIVTFGASGRLPFPALWQIVSLAMLTAAVYFFARWQIVFTYWVEEDDRDPRYGLDLTVSRRTGRKSVTDCRLGLGDLQVIDPETPQNRKELRRKYKDIRVHSYCPDVLPARAVYLTFDDAGDRVVIRIQPSDGLLAMLETALQK